METPHAEESALPERDGLDLLTAAFTSDTEAGRERVRLAIGVFGLAFFESDLATESVLLSPNGFALFGLPVPATPQRVDRATFWGLYHPQDLASARSRFAADLAGSRGRDDYREKVRILRADDGKQRWLEFTGHMFGPAGARTHIVGMLRDVTAEVEAEERRILLAREVEHRANNTLAVIQALVRLTRGPELGAYRAALEGRILALGRTQALTAGQSQPAPLAAVLEVELAAYADHVTARPGTVPPLAAECVQPVAMILHELATNAAKHGALSRPGGRIEVAATAEAAASGTEEIVLRWTEQGGPAIAAPPDRTGTGLSVVRGQARRLGGTLAHDWAEAGLRFTLRVPRERWAGR